MTKPPSRNIRRLRRKHFTLIRSFVLADLITLVNAAAGTGAIFACLAYMEQKDPTCLWLAFALLPLALVADVLDGFVARWRRKQSPLGADLDSLADVISFGVAPAVLGYTMGLKGGWDILILIYFVTCGISRLARFNVTAAALSEGNGGKVKHFEGTPIPTSLALVIALAVAYGQGAMGAAMWFGSLEVGPWTLHPLTLMYAASGSAMISATLRIPKP